MAPVLVGGTLKSLAPEAVRGFLMHSLDLRNNPQYDAFVNSIAGAPVASPTGQNTYVDLGLLRQMRKRHGPRKVERLRETKFTITNEPYENSLVVYDWEVRRDQFGLVQKRIGQLRETYFMHWQILTSQLLALGETELSYDGVAFFSASHVEADSGTQSNLITITGVVAPDAPTVAEFKRAVWAAISKWRTLKDDFGEPSYLNTSDVWLVIPHYYEQVANEALNPRQADTTATTLVVEGTTFHLVVDNRQGAASGEPLYRAIELFLGNQTPIVRQTELDLELGYKDETFDNRRELYGVDTIRGIGFGDWKSAIKVKLST
jgi:phage major head subunit gpT-like protein